MNPLLEVWFVAARDLRKSVRSLKGVLMLGIALLGALASTVKLPKFEEAMDDLHKLEPDQLLSIKAQLFGRLYRDEAAGQALAGAPLKLVILFFVAVWLVPLLVMITGFDAISADLQHRSVRYWAVRARRPSYYAGKFLALWVVIGLVTLVMQAIIWGVTVTRGEALAGETLSWGVRLWGTSLAIAGAWCGVATLMSSLSRTPMLSLLMTAGVFFLLFFFGFVIGTGGDVGWLRYLYPNNFDGWIVSGNRERALAGLGVCLAWIVGTSGVGAWVFWQRDV